MVSQFAQNEQSLNAVERILVYTQLPSEGDPTRCDDPSSSWPEQGGIRFTDVAMAYREGLPLVLKGITFEIQPGEKVSSVRSSKQKLLTNELRDRSCGPYGRRQKLLNTGTISVGRRSSSHCSNLISTVCSIVELQSGHIEIDGTNISDVGLDTLRHRLALVPQDSTLFLGTLRENM